MEWCLWALTIEESLKNDNYQLEIFEKIGEWVKYILFLEEDYAARQIVEFAIKIIGYCDWKTKCWGVKFIEAILWPETKSLLLEQLTPHKKALLDILDDENEKVKISILKLIANISKIDSTFLRNYEDIFSLLSKLVKRLQWSLEICNYSSMIISKISWSLKNNKQQISDETLQKFYDNLFHTVENLYTSN